MLYYNSIIRLSLLQSFTSKIKQLLKILQIAGFYIYYDLLLYFVLIKNDFIGKLSTFAINCKNDYMARILAIDYGKRRTGLAVTDELQIIAGGLTTVETVKLFDFILDYLKKEQVELIIVGLPKQMNNEKSENMVRIEPFVNRLRKLVSIPVEYYDERFTSVLAHRAILESGIGKMARRNKALVDEISATIILQSYMESRRMKH